MKRIFGIQKKLLIYNIVLVVIVTLFFSLIIVRTFAVEQETIKNQNINDTRNMLIKLNSLYEDMDDATENLILDSYMQSILSKGSLSVSERENLETTIAYSNRDGSMYYFVTSDGRVYSNKNVTFDDISFEDTDLNDKLSGDYAKLHFVWTEDVFSGNSEKALFVCRNIRSLVQAQETARIIFVINDEKIRSLMPERSSFEESWLLFSDLGDACFASNGTGKEVPKSDMDSISSLIQGSGINGEQDVLYTIENSDGFLCAGYHAATGFTIATFASRAIILRSLGETFGWVGVVLAIGLIAAFIASVYLSRLISRPIKKISDVMGNFGMESLDNTVIIETNTELDQIGNAYNIMLGKIKELVDAVARKEQEQRKLELEVLLYQIHPHFLYNTLNTIYMMARQNKQVKIMEMIDSLSRFLQITLSSGQEEISIERELEHVCSYMKIQQIRNVDLFTYSVDCPDSLSKYVVPKMILQPLVENCIKHGFSEIMEGGHININISSGNGVLIIDVKDNGGMMDMATAEQMNRRLAADSFEDITSDSSDEGGYGVINVARRLKLKYGEKARIKYIISQGETICRVTLDICAAESQGDLL